MGQFLAIGITTNISIRKSEIEKAEFSCNQFVEKMKASMFFQPDIYTQYEEDDYIVFNLKDEIFQSQLIDFLKAVYPVLYKDSNQYYKPVLESLTSMEPAKWKEWAADSAESAFQDDPYGARDYLFGAFRSRIAINYHAIILSLEGKILMEQFGRQFHFFKYTMMQAFKEFSLSGALRVYITG